MAITPAALQAALGTNPMNAQCLMATEVNAGDSNQRWFCIGNAATQAAACLTALRA